MPVLSVVCSVAVEKQAMHHVEQSRHALLTDMH